MVFVSKSLAIPPALSYSFKNKEIRHTRMINFKTALLLGLSTITLSACQTLEGAWQDINAPFQERQSSLDLPQNRAIAPAAAASPCPEIEIVDELSSMSEFEPANKTEPENLVSRVNLKQVESTCRFSDDYVAVDLKLAFESSLGAKAKLRKNDKPFFSYPFFVAVADPDGYVLAKEIFGASMTYERNEESHTYFEKMRQLIPINRKEDARHFKVMLGFQLDESQLDYNRENMIPANLQIEPEPVYIESDTISP